MEIIQNPTAENGHMAIVKAQAESKLGELFVDVGDATPTNCNAKVAKHLLRMASTRAKARALRDFTNIGMTCLEELGDLNDITEEEPNHQTPAPKKAEGHQKGNPQTGGPGSCTAGRQQRVNAPGQDVRGPEPGHHEPG